MISEEPTEKILIDPIKIKQENFEGDIEKI